MKLKQRLIIGLLSFIIIGTVYIISKQFEEEKFVEKYNPGRDSKKSLHNINSQDVVKPPLKIIKGAPVEQDKDFKDEKKQSYITQELDRLMLDFSSVNKNSNEVFKIAEGWVTERQIYPHNHPELSSILKAMTSSRIIEADALPKGTQIKLLLTLEGGQRVVFKQKRYSRDHVIEGKPYDGYDRHYAEVAAFHIDRIFDFRRAPLVVGRVINLETEIKPVATKRLLDTFRVKNGNLCYFGVCYYCKEENMACAEGEVMEGALTLWLPPQWSKFEKKRHPYQRTYVNGRKAKWESDETYCDVTVKKQSPYDRGSRLLDITDGTVFDYLIGNADRHHYEVFKDGSPNTMMLMMDNAKSFGNPGHHEESILAPLRQCCLLRNSTWSMLHKLKDGTLTIMLESILTKDPISPVLHTNHYSAIDTRFPKLIETVETCIKHRGKDKVIVDQWNGL